MHILSHHGIIYEHYWLYFLQADSGYGAPGGSVDFNDGGFNGGAAGALGGYARNARDLETEEQVVEDINQDYQEENLV